MADEVESIIPLEEGLTDVTRPVNLLWTKFAGLVGKEDDECVRVLFTSPVHGTGTTTMTCCTALGLARNTGESVIVVESNLYTPAVAQYLGLPNAPGMTDCLDGKAEPAEVIRPTSVEGLHVVSAGTTRPVRPGELHQPLAHEVFKLAVAGRRYVLADGPPIIDHPEWSFQLEMADYIVLVVEARRTKRRDARRAMRVLLESGTPVLGTIVNRFRSDMPFGIGAGAWK
jgi:Mrp family chromosome partitioning ATPase